MKRLKKCLMKNRILIRYKLVQFFIIFPSSSENDTTREEILVGRRSGPDRAICLAPDQ